jgi:hypothetical protein
MTLVGYFNCYLTPILSSEAFYQLGKEPVFLPADEEKKTVRTKKQKKETHLARLQGVFPEPKLYGQLREICIY